MKNFPTILGFELRNYFKNKSYMILTILIGVLAIAAMFLPRFFNLFGDDSGEDSESQDTYAVYDESGVIPQDLIASFFPDTEIRTAASADEVRSLVETSEAAAGFVVTSPTEYQYYVFNKTMGDSAGMAFTSLMQTASFMKYCSDNGLNFTEVQQQMTPAITYTENILGKDSGENFWYCYGLVILVFMLIILYGVMIATSITQEKSNRSIEVLVTSTNTTSLLFGKVIAGALASLFQVGFVLGGVLLSYEINRSFWGGRLDFILHIPGEVLITFALFGLGGFLFYAFLYGMMGALVSKTEDINKTAGNVQMLIMVVYFLVLFQIQNPDGIIMKVASFLPFSSYSAMFVRIAMGSVTMVEVVIAFGILVLSILGVGYIGAKVYRNSTLRYGNPLKLRHAVKGVFRKG
ncbi:ABC transporter permease [Cuneatibacter sp. NSJ-177]|uniref:ABC transporter permease n=1 Tax=Cuneatibacter sp. NSJ-177 TaxID=2931401 RepID=UPI001FCFE68E|nr:ABC transporter permease [Cuneatibacter sp. NSJ-177]MCJ7837223.1 ABC transporter permease [Cuneatibacter sp. NSJ-177]